MIPLDFITEWRRTAPWIHDSQVEQDLLVTFKTDNPGWGASLCAGYALGFALAAVWRGDLAPVELGGEWSVPCANYIHSSVHYSH